MEKSTPKRIVLIHALPFSMAPAMQAFTENWPEAELVNLLDDSLSVDRKRAQSSSADIIRRIVTLGDYADSIHADAILFTCSAFGEAIDRVKRRLDIPVLKPNEAMFEEALQAGGKIGMLTTFGPSVGSMEAEFKEQAAEHRSSARLTTILVEEAMDRLDKGDDAGHNALLQQAAARCFRDYDLIMLAQFSNAQAHDPVAEVFKNKILTSPVSAVLRLKQVLCPDTSG